MRNSLLIAAGAAIALNILATFIGRGSFLHVVSMLGLAVWVVGPMLLSAAVVMVVAAKLRERKYFRVAYVLFLGLLVLGSLSISAYFGHFVRERDIAHAKRYCESLVPALDRHKNQHGQFPVSLDSTGRSGGVPRLLRGKSFYTSDGEEFRFEFGDPGALMAFVAYNSNQRAWYTWH